IVRVKARPFDVTPLTTVAGGNPYCACAAPRLSATTAAALPGSTVLSRSPWKTIAGTVVVRDFATRGSIPSRIAVSADGKSCAAWQASPECTPIAAKMSGYAGPTQADKAH